jgi:tetratricopeptide (TPR) repeat protein
MVAAFGVGAARTAPADAQAAIDPNVAPRAAQLERQGERHVAVDLLGRYLAIAPDDGRAWFQLGRFYLLDGRDWHRAGHRGDPDGMLYLDFAVTAFDQSVRLLVDSGVVYRNIAEMERALIFVEDSGWEAARERRPRGEVPPPPPYLIELGLNLLNSCPANGVLLTGSELETMSVWYVSLERRQRADVVPIRPELYATDSLYRGAMARRLGVESGLPVQRALAVVAARRPLCLAPSADSAAAPATAWVPFRLARVSRLEPEAGDALSVIEIVSASRPAGSPWVREVRGIYENAAARNIALCGPLVLLFGDAPPPACRR